MGLTSAMYTSLTGLDVNQTRIETIGHNIANVNTHAYKGSRALFQTLFARTMSMGTAPSETSGGTNPMQIGTGASVGSIQRTTTIGALETTGVPSDLAIEGAGYFLVNDPNGRTYYTRNGAFSLNAVNQLVTIDGHRVQGFGVDDSFAVIPGQLTGLSIPLGQEIIARATEYVTMEGVLSAATLAATAGSDHRTQAMVNGGGGPADAGTALTDVRSATAPGATLFADGDVITVSGVGKGERDLPSAQFTVGTNGTTLGDFATWLQNALGIQVDPALPGAPGVVIEGGQLVIRSNAGEPNAISITTNDILSSNAVTPVPFQFTQAASAQGGGVFTSFTVYDSLGTPVGVNATFTLDSKPDTGPVWRYYLETAEAGNSPRALGSGTVSFDVNGNVLDVTNNQFTIDRSGTGAAPALAFTFDVFGLNGLSTRDSNVIMGDQDGYPPGVLTNFAVDTDGTIHGSFSNGLLRPLGQIAIATFLNDVGLVAESDNLFSLGPNSGPPQVTTPGAFGAGTVRGGALEMSNVDLTAEFIGLITSSTAFQANSRVITVSNEMLDQLLLALR